MRSAHDTTSPSGVPGAGLDQLWLRMPSSVSRTEVEIVEHDIGAPHRVVVALGQIRREGVFAGVAARAVAAVVAERDRLDERNIEPQRPADARGDLRDLERVREPRALVIGGEDEDLRLARQPAKRTRVQDAITVSFEARAHRVGGLFDATIAGTARQGGAVRERGPLERFAIDARERRPGGEARRAVVDARGGRRRRAGPASWPPTAACVLLP